MDLSGVIFDLDGTIYRGSTLLLGASALIHRLESAGLTVRYCSNNPTKSPERITQTLTAHNIPITPDQIITATTITDHYLQTHHANDPTYVIGDPAISAQLTHSSLLSNPRKADVLVVGYTRDFSYGTFIDALAAFDQSTPVFLGTDPDRTVPNEGGSMVPGSGAIIGAIEATVGTSPDKILGKPSAEAAAMLRNRLGHPPEHCLIVGDRLDTDITLGETAGMHTALVTTGAHDRSDITPNTPRPDHVLSELNELSPLIDGI